MIPKKCLIGKPPKPRKRTPKADLEGAVVKECLVFLRQHPNVVYVERRNTGAVQFEDGGYLSFGSKGAADIWCIAHLPDSMLRGVSSLGHVEVECKRRDGKGRLSKDQKAFQAFCKDTGILYFVVTSAVELSEKLAELVVDQRPRPW